MNPGVKRTQRYPASTKRSKSYVYHNARTAYQWPHRADPKRFNLEHRLRKLPTGAFEEEAEIHALERKLGLNGNAALPRPFREDGLAALLAGLGGPESGADSSVEKNQPTGEEQRLDEKERGPLGRHHSSTRREFEQPDALEDIDEQCLERLDPTAQCCSLTENDVEYTLSEESRSQSSTPSISKDSAPSNATHTVKANENSYIPLARRHDLGHDLSQQRLQRHVQRLLNKLSTSNFLSIVGSVEELYGSHPAGQVTPVVIDGLLNGICNHSHVGGRFVILMASFIAALFRTKGITFGLPAVQRIVWTFDTAVAEQEQGHDVSKKLLNMIALLARLYNFKVIGSVAVYDLLSEMTRKPFLEQVEVFSELLGGLFLTPICDVAD